MKRTVLPIVLGALSIALPGPLIAAPPATDIDAVIAANRAPGPDLEARTATGLAAVLAAKGRVRSTEARLYSALRFVGGERVHRALASLADLRGRRALLMRRGPGDLSSTEYAARQTALDHQVAWLERYVEGRLRRVRIADDPSVDVAAVRGALPADGALIEMVAYRAPDGTPAYAAYALPATGAVRFVDLGPVGPIDAAADALRAAARDPGRADVSARSKALSRLLVDPLWPDLGSTRRWIVAPDGPLHMVPFAALTAPDGRWLDETHVLGQVHAGRVLARLNERVEAGEPPLVVADPLFEDGGGAPPARVDLARLRFPRLPGTAVEAEAIAAVLPRARVLRGAAATEAAIKRARGPAILHLATHGFFLGPTASPAIGGGERGITLTAPTTASDPVDPETAALLDAGLALAGANRPNARGEDGVLTALEAAALDLRGTALVVLSACETGLGRPENGEGLAGFQRALGVAGAESQLLTLWKVDDRSTSALMADFYGRLGTGESRVDALRAARAALRADPKTAHPFHWAAFTLAGDWRPVVLRR